MADTLTGGVPAAPIDVRMRVKVADSSNNAIAIYTVAPIGASSVRGIYMYMDTCTTAPDILYGMDIGIVGTGISTNSHFIRMYNHGTDVLTSVFCLDNAAQDIATNLFVFGAADQLPLSASTSGEAVVQKVACLVGGATRYLHLHSQ